MTFYQVLKESLWNYLKILKQILLSIYYHLSVLNLKLNRRIKLLSKKNLYEKKIVELNDRKILSGFLIIRILGNDHYPIHSKDQTLNNLKYILQNEPDFKNCRKCFVLNRIIDKKIEQDLIDLLEKYPVDYLLIPFSGKEYAETGWRVDEFGGVDYFSSEKFYKESLDIKKRQLIWAMSPKINYAMNLNGARNLALEEGKRTANWTFVLDGNCIFKKKDFDALCFDCTQPPHFPYITIPFARLSKNIEYLKRGFIPEAIYEPQVGFHFTAKEGFNPLFPYGIISKAELLKILGVPGKWTHWGGYSWQKSSSRHTKDRYLFKTSGGMVMRLSSGNYDREIQESAQSRFQDRLDAMSNTIQYLTDKYGTENSNFYKIIFSDKNRGYFQFKNSKNVIESHETPASDNKVN